MYKPKLFVMYKEITWNKILNDIVSGSLVGVVALPLAIAFGIASGVTPESGIITAIIGGFIVSFLGGSRVQIGGPTGAFIVIVYGIVQQYGVNGLMVATLMAGFILIVMGIAQFGSIIKFIPYPVVVGFTSGIAVVIFSTQIPDFFGLKIQSMPSEVIYKWGEYIKHLDTINYQTVIVSMLSLLIIVLWPKISRKIPGSIIAILFATFLTHLFNMNIETIGSRFGEIHSFISFPSIPNIDLEIVRKLILPATTIAILAAIEALLSAVVSDGMIGGRHKSNAELIAQGVANIFSPLFGGIPVTGAIARTATNVKNGGRTPISGMVHAFVLLLIMVLLGRWVKLIPMATLSAILIIVAFNMSEYRVFRQLVKSPRSDVAVLLTTFTLTIIVDLTVAIEVGMILAAILFMRRMSMVTNIGVITRELKDPEYNEEFTPINGMNVPQGVEIYEINGPFFFGAANKFKEVMHVVEKAPQVRILRMRNVPAIDSTGLHLLKELYNDSKKSGVHLILSGVHAQPLSALQQFGLYEDIGPENIFSNIDESINRARELLDKFGELEFKSINNQS